MEYERTINFCIWKNGKWVKAEGIISVALLCARPGCRKKPHKAAKYNQKKFCSHTCRAKHQRALGKHYSKRPAYYEKSKNDILPFLPIILSDVL